MGILAFDPRKIKGGSGTLCRACGGTGNRNGRDCFPCGSTGRVVQGGDDGSPPPEESYEAWQPGGFPVETARTFDGLLSALEDGFKLMDEELCVFHCREGRGPRVVAVVKPGRRGNVVVRV